MGTAGAARAAAESAAEAVVAVMATAAVAAYGEGAAFGEGAAAPLAIFTDRLTPAERAVLRAAAYPPPAAGA